MSPNEQDLHANMTLEDEEFREGYDWTGVVWIWRQEEDVMDGRVLLVGTEEEITEIMQSLRIHFHQHITHETRGDRSSPIP